MINLKLLLFLFLMKYDLVHTSCPSSFYDCGNDRCIASFWRCDGEDDCGNWADEHDCHNLKSSPLVKDCPLNHTHCNDTHDTCVPNKWICDGMEDCANGADEKNCSIASVKCIGFMCHNFECIPSRWKCDGIPDCDDNSDELNCPKAKKEICDKEHGFYQCFTGQCIPHLKVCDNHKDCPQGDDEGMECKPTGCHSKNCSQLCFVAPEGPQCYCRSGFVLDSDNETCIDRNECESNKMSGLCSQTCINLDGGYKCECLDDYKLVHNTSCVVKVGEPLLLFSNSEGIRGLWLESGRYFPIYHSLTQTVGLDYLGSEDRIFWVDLDKSQSGVYSVGLDGTDFEPIITNGLKSPEDLAIDWIAKNVYITDAQLNAIIVCELKEKRCSSTLFGQLDLPRAIVVNPLKGMLYWSEWGKTPGIYESRMDGLDKVHLIQEKVIWPNGLALDFVANRLYWSEAKFGKIEFYDFETNERKTVLSDQVFHPFSLAVFEDFLYWSDWMTYSLDVSHKFSGHNQTTLIREANEHIMGVHVVHPLIQKSVYNPCWSHTCSHICVLAPNRTYSCVCPDYLVLSKDNSTCVDKPDNPFLFVSFGEKIQKLYSEAIGKDVMIDVNITKGLKVGDITFNWKTNTLYIFDFNKLAIGSIQLGNAINSYWNPLITTQLDRVGGLTYDSHTNNLYWLETRAGILEVATVDGKSRAVILNDLDKPIDLALHPEHRRLYVAVMGSNPHIMVADTDGKNPNVLIASKNGFAVSITIDKLHNKLFWSDAKNGIIEWMDLFSPKGHSSSRGVVVRNLGHVMSIAVHNYTLFWTEMDSDVIDSQTMNTKSPKNSKFVLKSLHKGKSEKKLLLAQAEATPIGPCTTSNGGCSHICLLGRFGPTCMCPNGYKLLKDNQNCEKLHNMTDNSILSDCEDCVTSGNEDFEMGFIRFENSDEEDLNWFTKDEDEDKEVDLIFSRYDSKHKVNEKVNTNGNNDNSGDVKNEQIDATTSRATEVTTKVVKQKKNKKQKNANKPNVKNTNLMNESSTKGVIIESFKSETENQTNASHRKGWLTLFVAVLIVVIVVLLILIIIKKDEYSDVRNVLYRRGDQLKGAIVKFQNPLFGRGFRKTDEEEPLNEDLRSLNEEKY